MNPWLTIFRVVSCATAVCFAACLHLPAQTASGRVEGVVRDIHGEGIAGASVTLVGESPAAPPIGVMRTVTDSRGAFLLTAVPAGHYRLQAALPTSRQQASTSVVVGGLAVQAALTLAPEAGTSLDALSLDGAGSAGPPSFSVAGVEGTIAPSGYAAGVAERQVSQLAATAATIESEPAPAILFSEGALPCTEEPHLRQQLAAAPSDAEANHRMGVFYVQHGDADRGLPFLVKSEQANPQDRRNTLDLAVAYRMTKRDADARALLERHLQAVPQDAVAHALLGATLASLNLRREAAVEFHASAALDASEANLFRCGLGLINGGDAPAAELLFQEALAAQPSSARLWLGLGLAQSQGRKRPEAMRSLLRAVALRPGEADAYALLALLTGTSAAADREIERSLDSFLQHNPDSAIAHYDEAIAHLGSAKSRSSAAERAGIEEQLTTAVRLDPTLAGAHFQLGVVYADAGDDRAAATELATAARLHPDDAETHYRLAQVYRRLGRVDSAQKETQVFDGLHGRPSEEPPFRLDNEAMAASGAGMPSGFPVALCGNAGR